MADLLKPTITAYPALATGLDPGTPAHHSFAAVSDFPLFATPNTTITKYEHNQTVKEVRDTDPLVWDIAFESPVTVKGLSILLNGLLGLPVTTEVEADKCYSHVWAASVKSNAYYGVSGRLLTGNGHTFHINKLLWETLSLKADPQKTLIMSVAGKGFKSVGGKNPASYSLESETAYIRADTNSTHTIAYGGTTINLPNSVFSADESINIPLDIAARKYGSADLDLPLHTDENVTANFSKDVSMTGLDVLGNDDLRLLNLMCGGNGAATEPTTQNYDSETLVTVSRYFRGGLCGGSETNRESITLSFQGYLRGSIEQLQVAKIRRNFTGSFMYKAGTLTATIQSPVVSYTVPAS